MADPAAGAAGGGVPMAAAPGVVVPVAVPAALPAALAAPARTCPKLRLRWAQMLFILGCAAAALAAFSMNYSSSLPALGAGCAPTVADAAALRGASEKLLLAAVAQVLGATTAVLLPGRPITVAIFGTIPGAVTGYIAGDVLFLLVACHGELHGELVEYYYLFSGLLAVAYLAGGILSLCPCSY